MSDDKNPKDKPNTTQGAAAAGKKPHATLDLKATEVKPAPGAATAKPQDSKDTKSAGGSGSSASSSVPGAGSKPGGDKTEPGKPAAPSATATSAAAAGTKPTDTKASDTKTADGKPGDAKSAGAKPDDAGPKPSTATQAARGSSPPPKPQRSGGGIGAFFTHLVAGVFGGFLALLGAESLQPQLAQLKTNLGLPATGEDAGADIGKLESRLAALETTQSASQGNAEAQAALDRKVTEAEGRLAELDSLKSEIAALKEQQVALSEQASKLAETAGSGEGGTAVSEERIAKLEQQLSTMAAFAESNQDSGSVPRLAALTGRMADLEQTLENQIAAVRSGLGQDVEKRLAEIETSSEAARSGTQRIDRQLSTVTNDTARLGQQIETLKADTTRLGDTLRVVQEETGKISSQLSGFEGDVSSKIAKLARPTDIETAVKPVADQIMSLEGRVADVVSAEKDRRENAKRIVLTLELANLERAIERGDSFEAELGQVKKTADGLIDVSALEQYGAAGVASVSRLQSSFRPVAHQIIEGSAAPPSDSVFDQLLANARSVVKVRKVNHDAGDKSAEAVVSRIEQAIDAGRLGEVLTLAGDLPEGGKQAAAGWLKQVEDRHAVDRALGAVAEQLKASLSGTN